MGGVLTGQSAQAPVQAPEDVLDDAVAPKRRLVVYAISRAVGGIDDFVFHALVALRPLAVRLIVIAPRDVTDGDSTRLSDLADGVVVSDSSTFEAMDYAIVTAEADLRDIDEVVFTGDSWFGPAHSLSPVIDSLSRHSAPVRAILERPGHALPAFPDAGFETPVLPWSWTALDPVLIGSEEWQRFWSRELVAAPKGESEAAFQRHMAGAGHPAHFAFAAADFPTTDPAVFAPTLLLDRGCPIVLRTMFLLYPPHLDRFAVIGREVLQGMAERDISMGMVWQNLARSVQPKALYAIGGLLEVLPEDGASYDPGNAFRIAVVVHATDLESVDELFKKLDHLPTPYHLFVTTTDGKKASRIQRVLERRDDPRVRAFDVRVTPPNRGRDMSDFFVGCRDVLLGDRFDLVVKVHARRMRDKTMNVRRYFRRYQYDNLLSSPGYVANLLALFQHDPGLGVVFPPMMHIGYSTMGGAWGGKRGSATKVAGALGIHVPFDAISPFAPLGGMWICRPEALEVFTRHGWRYRDFARRAGESSGDLARVLERLIAYGAAERGFHSRTVLTREHAAISHTALESKTDYLLSTTRGWPVEQIQMMQRAGDAGHLGVVALLRMYIRVNHPRIARLTMPLFVLALRAVVIMKYGQRGLRLAKDVVLGRPPEDLL